MLRLLHPLYLLALLPLLMLPYLMRRGPRAARSFDFAAMALLHGASVVREHRGLRLPPRALLLVRLAAAALLVLALARPELPARPGAASAPMQALVVLDTSPSMAYRFDGRSLIERAVGAVDRELRAGRYPGGVGLLCTDAHCAQQLPLGASLAELRGRLGEPVALVPGESLAATLLRAQQLIAQRGLASDTEVLVASDRRASAWAEGSALPRLAQLRWLSLVDGAEEATVWPNLGLGGIALEPGFASGDGALTAHFFNWGDADALRAPYVVEVDGHEVMRGDVDVPAHGGASRTVSVALPVDTQHAVAVRLASPGPRNFPSDDVAHLIAPPQAVIEVVAINGEPSETQEQDELYFFAEALRALPEGERPLRLRQVGRAQLGRVLDVANEPGAAPTRAPDVLVLANVGAVSEAERRAISDHVAAGMGLFVSAGAQLDLEHTAAAYEALLGVELRAVDDVRAQDAAQPQRAPFGLRLATGPLGALLGEPEIARALGATHTVRRLAIAVPPGHGQAAMLFDDGAPALWLGEHGQGRVALWTTSLDVAWSDAAIGSAFVPVSQAWMRWLGRADARVQSAVRQGGSLEVDAQGLAAVRLVGPNGEELLARSPQGRTTLGPLGAPGIWRGEVARGEGEAFVAAPWLDRAVLVAGEEQDFAPARGVWAAGDTEPQRLSAAQDGWLRPYLAQVVPALLLVAACLLVLEGVLSRRRVVHA